MDIGFNLHNLGVLEGSQSGLGRPINSNTIFLPAHISSIHDNSSSSMLPNNPHVQEWKTVFREDYLDPQGRIRRGRFYTTPMHNPQKWVIETSSGAESNFYTFNSVHLRVFQIAKVSDLKIMIGTSEAFSDWRVIRLEYINTGEVLVTLKAKNLAHILPEINYALLPIKFKEQISNLYEKLLDEIPRGLPESII